MSLKWKSSVGPVLWGESLAWGSEHPWGCAFCGHPFQSHPGDVRQSRCTYLSSRQRDRPVSLVLLGLAFLKTWAKGGKPFNCSVASIPQVSVLLLLFPPPSVFLCKPGLTHAFFFACFALFHFQNKLFLSSELCIPGGEPCLLLLPCQRRQGCSASPGLIFRAPQQAWVVGALQTSRASRESGTTSKALGHVWGYIW